jgi:hypothetical protein
VEPRLGSGEAATVIKGLLKADGDLGLDSRGLGSRGLVRVTQRLVHWQVAGPGRSLAGLIAQPAGASEPGWPSELEIRRPFRVR